MLSTSLTNSGLVKKCQCRGFVAGLFECCGNKTGEVTVRHGSSAKEGNRSSIHAAIHPVEQTSHGTCPLPCVCRTYVALSRLLVFLPGGAADATALGLYSGDAAAARRRSR